jgi:hypothetical protein
MDEDNNPDRLLSEPPEQPPQSLREKMSNLSVEPSAPSDEATPPNGEPDVSVAAAAPPPPQPDPNAKIVRDVVTSEVSAARV